MRHNIITDNLITTISSVAVAFNWHVLEPVLVQLGFLFVAYLRQEIIKVKRRRKSVKNGDLEGKE